MHGSGQVPTIIVHAPDITAVGRALASCRAHARWVADPSILSAVERSDDCCIALVAVDGCVPNGQPLVATINALVKKGFKVVCYREGACKWALTAQCSLLVAGASQLLDSADPAFVAHLSDWVTRALNAEADMQSENRRLEDELLALGVVGRSRAIIDVFRWVLRASPLSGLPVLIVGETGTGKELVARAIHQLDPVRRSRPFVPVNCGAINAGLAESQLFGHRRGAFTGAERDRKGLVRAALGGVLFLDEIGDLDGILQGKLLRVLQEHRVLGLGEDHEVAVDVRIVAATNRDLEEMVREGTFRADLFHRLNVLSVRVPPLRERPEDIEPLVRHFLASCAQAQGRPVSPTEDFLEGLARVDLPGNVRQLENLIRRAYVTSRDDDQLGLNALPPELWRQLAPSLEIPAVEHADSPVPPARAVAHGQDDAADLSMLDPLAVLEAHSWNLERSLDFCEDRIVTAALGLSHGNRSRAATMLGISPRSIFNKMRKHRVA